MRLLKQLVVTAVLTMLTAGYAEAQTVKVNEEFTGKFPAQPVAVFPPNGAKAAKANPLHFTTLTVDLKQDQKVTITLAVEGDRRCLGIAVVDKNGQGIGSSFPSEEMPRGARITAQQWITGTFGVLASPNNGPGGPGGPRVAVANKLEPAKTAELNIAKAPLTGRYTILVMSDTASEFTLNVVDEKADKPAKPKRDAAAVEKELQQLKQRIGELEKELKELEKAPAKIGK